MSIALTQEDIDMSKNGCVECQVCLEEIARFKQLGLDVGELEERAKQLLAFHQKVIELYQPLIKPLTKSQKRK